MASIYSDLTQLIGHTPLLELGRMAAQEGLHARVIAKLERQNPGGSVKDRVALAMIEDAERRGVLQRGGTIIEPTSGNTGIGIAWVASVRGYKAVLTMPESMSRERQALLRALGATIVLTPRAEGMKGAIRKAEELQSAIPGSVILGQFENPANPLAHRCTTAQEIWADTDGEVDIFVAGVGTGGTVSGVAEALKQHKPGLKVYAVEPLSSPVLSDGKAGAHQLQGIGAGFVPANYHAEVIDSVCPVSDEDALLTARRLAQTEGLLVGISSGAAVYAALQLALQPENSGKTIVVLLPDTGERYLSTALFSPEV